MPTEAKIQSLTETLLPLAIDVENAAREVREWRQDAGAKSKWSAHQKMHEFSLSKSLTECAKKLENTLTPYIPAEWKISHWGFRPTRMGNQIRWAAKGGKGHDGEPISLENSELVLNIGAFIGLIAFHDQITDSDATRMKETGLTYGEIRTFSISLPNCFVEATAKSPVSAFASILFQKPSHFYDPFSRKRKPEEACSEGIELAKTKLKSQIHWSLAPDLWSHLRKHKVTRRVYPHAAPEYFALRPPWEKHNLQNYDRTLAAAIALLRSIKPPKPGTKLQPFLLNKEATYEVSMGWCGSSTVLRHIIETLYREDVPMGFENWKTFAMADECGRDARKVLRQLFPVCE